MKPNNKVRTEVQDFYLDGGGGGADVARSLIVLTNKFATKKLEHFFLLVEANNRHEKISLNCLPLPIPVLKKSIASGESPCKMQNRPFPSSGRGLLSACRHCVSCGHVRKVVERAHTALGHRDELHKFYNIILTDSGVSSQLRVPYLTPPSACPTRAPQDTA